MNTIDRKKIKTKDWKDFRKWTSKEQFNFKDTNFYSGLLSIKNRKLEKSFIDFYIYNKFVLEGKYNDKLLWPEWIIEIKGATIKEWLLNLIEYWFKDKADPFKELIEFLLKLREYKIQKEKNFDREYELVQLYWIFLGKIRDSKINNYNKWVIYVNKRIHKKLKGYK